MERTRLYNTSTGKWEYFTIRYVRMPWQGLGARFRAFLRYVRMHTHILPDSPTLYDFDPVALNMRDPKRERRMRRRERRAERFAKAVNALNSMVEMQKFIK